MKPKKATLFRVLTYIFEHPEADNRQVGLALNLPQYAIESRRAALIRKGFPIENPFQLQVVDCQPRQKPKTQAERVYLICELLTAQSKFTLEQTAQFSGLDLTLIESVKQKLDGYDKATCDDVTVCFFYDRMEAVLRTLKRNKRKTPHQIAKLSGVPLSMVFTTMRIHGVTCATDKESYVYALTVENPREWRKTCVTPDRKYLDEVRKSGYDGVRLPRDAWNRYREVYELKKRGLNWTPSGPVVPIRGEDNYGRTAEPVRFSLRGVL